MRKISYLAILFVSLALPVLAFAAEWQSFIDAKTLKSLKDSEVKLVIVDARSAEEYKAGHIPGAISVPGSNWRTGKAKPGEGDSQYIFRTKAGTPDIKRYEELIGKAGISNDSKVVVYGNHAGKADGSIPAFILDWLGHEDVRFLDGKGADEWQKAGFELETATATIAATSYKATPKPDFVWNLDAVVKNLENPDVLFYDTRSIGEFKGEALRSNRFGGRIPGAVLIDYAEFLDAETKRVKSPEEVKAILAEKNISKDKTLVLYCQTATRVSLPALALKDLGYEKVAVYDASWHEYGNLENTPIEGKVEKSNLQVAETSKQKI